MSFSLNLQIKILKKYKNTAFYIKILLKIKEFPFIKWYIYFKSQILNKYNCPKYLSDLANF